MRVMQVLALKKKAQKGPSGPKAVEKTWVQNFHGAEFPNIVHFLFLLKPSFTCVIKEEKFFFGNVTTLLFWRCDRYWYEENCFLAM